jgi:hypothetical protein
VTTPLAFLPALTASAGADPARDRAACGDLDEAPAWYKRAVGVDLEFGDAWYNMGCAHAVRGDKALALRFLRLAALHRCAERALMIPEGAR